MRTVPRKSTPREIPPAFPRDLKPRPCAKCGRLILLCSRVDRRTGVYGVELAPAAAIGNVAIQAQLTGCAPTEAPCAYEVANATPFRWHDGHCGPSFVGQSRGRKVRS